MKTMTAVPALVLALAVALTLPGSAVAAVKGERIAYRQGDTELSGYLAYDDALAGKRPGVLVVPEWWGLTDYAKGRADQLAGLGYVAFAADVYGKGAVTDDPKKAGEFARPFRSDRPLLRSRVGAALDVLRNDARVDPGRVAAIGYCFGGMAVLELARGGAPVAGVVSFHGSLDTPKTDEPSKIRARVLVLHGGDDPFVGADQVAAFEEEMRKGGVDWQVNVYGGAVHSFSNPAADRYGLKGAAYDANADRRSWDAMRRFFDEILAGKGSGA